MHKSITQHMDIWTSAQAPKAKGGRGRKKNTNGQTQYGIKKLRELILDLAVRGKLVPQDPDDEPAGVLLERIAKEKARLVKEGKIKKQKKLPAIAEEDEPLGLPEGWAACKLRDVCTISMGQSPKGNTYNDRGKGVPLVNGPVEFGGNNPFDKTTAVKYTTSPTKMCKKGDLLLCVRGSTTGRTNVAGFDSCIGRGVAALGAFIDQDYFNYTILYNRDNFHKSGSGSTFPNISYDKIACFPFLLPPLKEQIKISYKLDDLMALCDRLEQEQEDNVSTHKTLVENVLSTLTKASGHEEFVAAWRRVSGNFDVLFTTEHSIDQLKQAILQLAVMGKLVPQYPGNEPASVLLEKIAEEKVRLIKKGKIKKQKALKKINEGEKVFDVPVSWEWSRIGELALFTEYGLSAKTFENIDGIPVLKMGDIQAGQILLGGQKQVSVDIEGLPGLFLKRGDLLYNRTNSAELVGKTGLFNGPDDEYTFASYLVRIRCPERLINPEYLNIAMNTPLFRETQIVPHLKQQCGQANVNATIMRNMVVPIPPLDEQNLIVKKVNELSKMCDALKYRLENTFQTQRQIADSIINELDSM
ncbi:MAG: restriction endonuclease subunit S [Desulfobacterales bacterium]|nr:restriction endonuclease subunit S [Desulfobacterales bacterium]